MTHGRFGDHPHRLGCGLCRITFILMTPNSEMAVPRNNAATPKASRRAPSSRNARKRKPPAPSADPSDITPIAMSNLLRRSVGIRLGDSVPARLPPMRQVTTAAAPRGKLTSSTTIHSGTGPEFLLKASQMSVRTATNWQLRAPTSRAAPAQPYGPDTGGKRRDRGSLTEVNLRFRGSRTLGV
jgi:hypothetical protein